MFQRRRSDQIALAIDAIARCRLDLLRALASGQLVRSAQDVADDHACAFGAWLHGPTFDRETRTGAAWRAIVRLHYEYHQSAARVTRLIEAGRVPEAEALLVSDYTTRSDDLIAGLETWRDELALGRRRV